MKQMKYIWVQVVKKDEMAIWIFLDRTSNFRYLNGYWKSSWIAQVPTSIIENRNPSMLPAYKWAISTAWWQKLLWLFEKNYHDFDEKSYVV